MRAMIGLLLFLGVAAVPLGGACTPRPPPCNPAPTTWDDWNRSLAEKCVTDDYVCEHMTIRAAIDALSNEEKDQQLKALSRGDIVPLMGLYQAVEKIRDSFRCPALPNDKGSFESAERDAIANAEKLWSAAGNKASFPRKMFTAQIRKSRQINTSVTHGKLLTCVRLAVSWRDLYELQPKCISADIGPDVALTPAPAKK